MNKKIFPSKSRLEELADEIKSFFEKKDASDIKVVFRDDKYANSTCTITLRRWGRGVGNLVSFANMKWVSEKLKTEKIDLENEYQQSGCETCDHGAYCEVDMVCYEINPFGES